MFVLGSYAGYEDIAAFLLEYGADPELENDVKWTAMDFASQAGNLNILVLLLRI